jgi:hypothetical protein
VPERVLEVPGSPTPYCGGKDSGNELEWRQSIARAAEVARGPVSAECDVSEGHFSVTVRFRFSGNSVLSKGDLDNLAKPVLDTLFHNRYARRRKRQEFHELTGKLFRNVEDSRVYQLNLSTESLGQGNDEGAHIRVTW